MKLDTCFWIQLIMLGVEYYYIFLVIRYMEVLWQPLFQNKLNTFDLIRNEQQNK